ncbi:choline-sulfatase [Lichenihabitans sp. Uapishka_5]|uniref:choline-sulfatase n=1 Tax=Lichenihabitans sp. Uapishka_5 TaxID=3037302 RepID=UPI0029E81086|nr:choline-sulfatase [Lichenihabitans sp. Uapishka_5]MDX7951050.1 choline-sulfatase [Lichenihabitans sp. Uapishka_5]
MPAQTPNILIVMVDQLNPAFLPIHGHPLVKAPNLARLAARGTVFDNAYCASPLCAPSRAALMTGALPSRTGAYDNAAEFRADLPTVAHYLRHRGYRTMLSGKMHFCGPDQQHGFEERLTTDIYPADYGWTPDWAEPEVRPSWYHNMSSVQDAGTCVRTNQIDFDEEVVFAAERALYDHVRGPMDRPFFLVASLTHPHDPFAVPQLYWDRYDHNSIDMPALDRDDVPLDPHTARLRHVSAMDGEPVTEAQVRNARHAYYGAIAFCDDQLGRLLSALDATGLADNTVVVFLSDHGEMLGERGLWYKMTFLEGGARVPLVVAGPGIAAGRRHEAVSLLDVLPTLVAIAGGDPERDLASPIDGRSLVPHLTGRDGHDEAIGEYLAEGAVAPMLMLRRGAYKFIHAPGDPDQLYDLAADPTETRNRADDPALGAVMADFRAAVAARWDLPALDAAVRASQRRRRLVDAALMTGRISPWDFQPFTDATRQYMRNTIDLDDLEARARFPRVRP